MQTGRDGLEAVRARAVACHRLRREGASAATPPTCGISWSA